MADRSSAYLFGRLFGFLARLKAKGEGGSAVDDLARELYGVIGDYDFNRYQMDADDDLRALGFSIDDEED